MDNKTPTITIDGKEYSIDSLSDIAKNIAGFVNKIDAEMQELKYQLDKAVLAKRQAVVDLKAELNKTPK